MPDVVIYTKYCPRCDRPYESVRSEAQALRFMEAHLEEAHPEYGPMYFGD